MTVDYLIIGQGICGTFLSHYLLKAGQNILVIDEDRPFTASKVASGIINPVTGRRMVQTWMIDELFSFATQAYEDFGKEINANVIRSCDLLMFHPTTQMQEAFDERYASDPEWLDKEADAEWKQYFNFNYGIGKITPCLHIDLHTLLHRWRSVLQERNILINEPFIAGELSFTDTEIRYRDIIAKKIIFCNGTDAFQLPYFNLLPYAKNKGEAIIASIPGLPADKIYKQGLTIVPWDDGLFWIGSTYEWDFIDLQPSEDFRKRTEQQLKFWLKIPFGIVDHLASERPATLERRPFVGLHPSYPSIGILNGMGTKGCSLAPYFAHQLTQYLLNGAPIVPQADVQRFKRILGQHTA